MKAYVSFMKKEFYEHWCTYKILIMGSVFLLLGMMNPLTAKITPQLLKSLIPEGIEINIGEPSAIDSWAQFFKNVPQMGLIVLLIVFSGIMANEFSRGTLINMLTKGLSRSVIILSKFTTAIIIWTFSYILCFGTTYIYTIYFWSGENINNIALSVFCLWLYGVFAVSVLILGGVIFKNNYGGLLFTAGIIVLQMIINIAPKVQKYNPISLASNNMALLTGEMVKSDFTLSIIICAVISILAVMLSVLIFNKKQI